MNQKILNKIPSSKVLKILQERVFPYILKGEIVKVDFKVKVMYENIGLNLEDGHAD